MGERPTILYCHCAFSDVLGEELKQGVLKGLCDAGVDFDATCDLCGLAARRGETLRRVAASPDVRIAACHPRAVRNLFAAAGAKLPERGVEIVNMRSGDAPEALRRLLPGEEADR